MKLSELFINDNGQLSRTQVNMWICHICNLGLVLWIALDETVFTMPLLWVMALYTVSSHLDRMDARRLTLKISKSGVEAEVNHEMGGRDNSSSSRSDSMDSEEFLREEDRRETGSTERYGDGGRETGRY